MRTLLFLFMSMGLCWSCNSRPQQDPSTAGSVPPAQQKNEEVQQEQQEVVLFDQGLDVAISTVRLPHKWTLQQDISSNPSTGLPIRFECIFIGPKNQYIRNYAAFFPYGSTYNISFAQAQKEAIEHVISPEQLETLNFGDLASITDRLTKPEDQQNLQRAREQGLELEIFEVSFSGNKNGKEYKGMIQLMSMYNPSGGFGSLVPSYMIFSPAEFFQDALEAGTSIVQSRKSNPEYEQTMAQIRYRMQQNHQQQMDQLSVAHQRRMADQKAAFASHQKNMAGLNQLQDVAHENYMKTLRSNGSFSSLGSDFGSHDKVIDQIHERQSFQDPWTGTTVSLDGQYEHNYTNGLGDYYRTNDASFDYNSLNGDWKPIEDLN